MKNLYLRPSPFSLQDVTNEIAVATTSLVAVTLVALGLTYMIGTLLKSVYVFSEWQKLGHALQMAAVKGLLYVGSWGAITAIASWIVHLLMLAAE